MPMLKMMARNPSSSPNVSGVQLKNLDLLVSFPSALSFEIFSVAYLHIQSMDCVASTATHTFTTDTHTHTWCVCCMHAVHVCVVVRVHGCVCGACRCMCVCVVHVGACVWYMHPHARTTCTYHTHTTHIPHICTTHMLHKHTHMYFQQALPIIVL